MPTLEELLADTQLTDNIEINLPSGAKVTVGQLRTFAKTQRDTAAAAQRDYEAKAKEAADARKKAEQLATDSLKLYEEATKMKAEGNDPPPARTGEIDWENDPVYRPVNSRLKKDLEPLAKALAEIETIKKGMAAATNFVISDYYERRWNALPADIRPKDKSWKDYLQSAKDQKIVDQWGIEDPIEAFNRSTAADREAAKLEAARKKGIEEGKKLAAEANITRPGSTPQLRKPADKPAFKSLAEAMEAAASDPEILRIANGDDAVA